MASILLTNFDLAMHKKNNFNDMQSLLPICIQYFYKGILYRSVLLLHKTTANGMLRLYVFLYTSKVVQAIIRTINKFSPLIIYLDFEASMTTHKLIKKHSYRQSCLISNWFGLRPFSEIIDADKKMAVAICLRESKGLTQLVSLHAVRLEHYASQFLR